MLSSTLRHLKVGAEVSGLDLNTIKMCKETSKWIKDTVRQSRLVIFRDQGTVHPTRQVEICAALGPLETVRDVNLPTCPNKHVLRITNEGSRAGMYSTRQGWHIDGYFMNIPFTHTILHMVSIPGEGGSTLFTGMREMVSKLTPNTRQRWEQIWTKTNGIENPNDEKLVHPLLYYYPYTKEPVLCYHLKRTEQIIWNYGSRNERIASDDERDEIMAEIKTEIDKADWYRHYWQEGDFIIFDNLAMAHCTGNESVKNVSDLGKRVLHLTSVLGTQVPVPVLQPDIQEKEERLREVGRN